MTWTYSGDPSATSLDQVRFMCGDTNSVTPLISNEEINFLLIQGGNPQQATQEACLAIMAKLARDVDYAIGPEKVTASKRYEAYKDYYATIRLRWISRNAAPSWDGASSVRRPMFDVGMEDNHNIGAWDLDDDSDRDG